MLVHPAHTHIDTLNRYAVSQCACGVYRLLWMTRAIPPDHHPAERSDQVGDWLNRFDMCTRTCCRHFSFLFLLRIFLSDLLWASVPVLFVSSLMVDSTTRTFFVSKTTKVSICRKVCWRTYGQIALNLEVCISNSHAYGTVTLAVIVTVSNGASHLKDNYHVLASRRNQQQDDSPTVNSS
jgi:hypothetical protein